MLILIFLSLTLSKWC